MKTPAFLLAMLLLAAVQLYAQQGEGTHESTTTNVFKPARSTQPLSASLS
jgi:hypothetical protein